MHPHTRLDRRRLLQIGGGLGIGALLAACGDDDDDATTTTEAAAEPGTSAPATSAATSAPEPTAAPEETAAPTTLASGGGVDLQLDPGSEQGALEIFDWEGYDDQSGAFWDGYTKGPFGESNPLKFTFLENDQQALAKVAAGFKTDVAHPCLAYTKNWLDADLLQPWDISEIPDFDIIPPSLFQAAVFDDKVYGIPWDWGFTSLVFRGDRVDPKEMSWNLLLDERYKGRIGFFTDGVDIIQVGGLINGVSDPNRMSTEEIEAAKQTMMKAKKNIRMFWNVQSDAVAELVAGNLDITYGWQDAWVNAKDELPDADVQWMQPVEGTLAWVCGYVLMKDTPRPGLAHEFVKCIPTAQNALALINSYYYGAAGGAAEGVVEGAERTEVIEALGLNDLEAALAPPKTWVLQYIPNRAEYVRAAEEVKAS